MAFPPTPDQIAQDVAPRPLGEPVQRASVVRFCGYLGEGAEEGAFRLYLHPWFHTWLELPEGVIVAQHKITDEDGRSYVWVYRDVELTRCYAASAVDLAQAEVDNADTSMATGYPRRP